MSKRRGPTPRRRPAAPPRRGRRLRLLLGAAVGAAIVVALVIGNDDSGGDDGKKGFDVGDVKAMKAPPRAFHVVYRVQDFAGGEQLESTEERWVRRPWEAKVETRSGGPPGVGTQTVTVSRFGAFSSSSPNSRPLVTAIPPGTPNGDLRLDTAVVDLVRAGAIQPRGEKRILGRRCQVFRVGEPIGTGVLPPLGGDELSDECIDERGIILEEVWKSKGRTIRIRRAVSVDLSPRFPADLFSLPGPLMPAAQGGGEVTEVTDDSRPPARFWELPSSPEGFRHRGRYVARSTSGQSSPAAPGIPILGPETIVDVYESGARFVLIEQGDISARPSVTQPARWGRKVTAGKLPNAELVPGVFGNQVRARPDAVRFVTVTASLPADDVLDIARKLRSVPGGQLTKK